MRPGFEAILSSTGELKLQVFSPQPCWVTFAREVATGTAAFFMGKLYYKQDLKTRFHCVGKQNFPSDAALILALFQQAGVEVLKQLEGEFVLVIFDGLKQRLLALRDAMGNYPLYWTLHQQTCRVSTNLQFLARQQPAAVNRDFLASFLMFPFAFVELATEQTALVGIQRLLPGNLLEFTSPQTVKKIWSWNWQEKINPLPNISQQEAGWQLRHIFQQAIQERLQNEKIAAHLSGGMDSSSIVCLAEKLLEEGNLITLSLVYRMQSLVGETAYIKMISDRCPHIAPHYLDGNAALDFQWFADAIPPHDEPYPGLFHLAMERALVEAASQLGVTAIFSGGGAESVVEGNRYYLADLACEGKWQLAWQLARQWARAKNESLWSIIAELGIAPLIPPLLRGGIPTLWRRGYGKWPKMSKFAIPSWINTDFARDFQLWGKARATMAQLSQYPVEEAFNQLGLQSAVGNWAAWYLAAPAGLRLSHPFLDSRVIAYCFSLPREWRTVPGAAKPLLQEAMAGILPEAIRTRRLKANFNEVYWRGLVQNLPALEEMVKKSAVRELDIFDQGKLIEAMGQHALGIGNVKNGSRITSSLAVIAWFDQLSV